MRYYQAYNERLKKIHGMGELWFSTDPTPELLAWLREYKVPEDEQILEIGCGEGRDAIHLAELGYAISACDISEQAIVKCKELSEKKGVEVDWLIADALKLEKVLKKRRYKWVYSIGTLHILVYDEDRQQFLARLYSVLQPGGRALLVNMGNGEEERKTDPNIAFEEVERNLLCDERKKVKVSATSCRVVSWERHRRELQEAGFTIERELNTINHEYGPCMTVYLSRPEL